MPAWWVDDRARIVTHVSAYIMYLDTKKMPKSMWIKCGGDSSLNQGIRASFGKPDLDQ